MWKRKGEEDGWESADYWSHKQAVPPKWCVLGSRHIEVLGRFSFLFSSGGQKTRTTCRAATLIDRLGMAQATRPYPRNVRRSQILDIADFNFHILEIAGLVVSFSHYTQCQDCPGSHR